MIERVLLQGHAEGREEGREEDVPPPEPEVDA